MNKFFKRLLGITLGIALVGGVGFCVSKAYAVPIETKATKKVDGKIKFGSATGSTSINSASVTGNDSLENEWTITTVGTTSFTPNEDYSQIGSSEKPATSITFTTTYKENETAKNQIFKNIEAKFGGFNDTAGTVTLKVGDETVGSGSLNGTTDVTVSSTEECKGTTLTITVTGISKGVKAYYISYEAYPTVSIKDAPTSLNFEDEGTLTPQATKNATDPVYSWSSSDEDVLMINSDSGDYIAVGNGEATITVTMTCEEYISGGIDIDNDTVKINVKGGAMSIQDAVEIANSLEVGETTSYSAVITGYITKLTDSDRIDVSESKVGTAENVTIVAYDASVTASVKEYAILNGTLSISGNIKNDNGTPELVNLVFNSYTDDAEEYAKASYEALEEACSTAGIPGVTDELWGARKTAYNGITDTYALAKLKTGTVGYSEDFAKWITRYEIIVTKGGKENFMDRTVSSEKEKVVVKSDSTVAVISVIALIIGASVIGGYFFIKKIKHE